MQVHGEYADRGLVLAAITQASVDRVETFALQHSVDYPVLAEATADFESHGIEIIWGSVHYLVDPDDEVVADGLAEIEEVLSERLRTQH